MAASDFELGPEGIPAIPATHRTERDGDSEVIPVDFILDDPLVLKFLRKEAVRNGEWDKATEYNSLLYRATENN